MPIAKAWSVALLGIDVAGAPHLRDLVAWLNNEAGLVAPEPPEPAAPPSVPDLADVVGQPEARWALEVAAAGGHHLLFTAGRPPTPIPLQPDISISTDT